MFSSVIVFPTLYHQPTLPVSSEGKIISLFSAEFWRQIPASEPYRVVLGDVRDILYNTSERWHHLLATGFSEIPEESTIKSVEDVNYLSCSSNKLLRSSVPYTN
jgi:hypothetical protein